MEAQREGVKRFLCFVFLGVVLVYFSGCATSLQVAAGYDDRKTIDALLKGGADINETDFRGFTALMQAASNGTLETVRMLLDRGADLNKGSSLHGTPLVLAAGNGRTEVVKLLLDRGADMNRVKFGGDTPLMWAAHHGHASTVRIFLERGADADQAVGKLNSSSNRLDKAGAALIEKIRDERGKLAQAGRTDGGKRERAGHIPHSSGVESVPPAIMAEPRDDTYAIVIGIENYRSLPKSDYSGRDATLMKAYLKALGYQERNIEFLTDEKATKTDLEKSLEAWLPNRVKQGGTVFVYFSGHGAPEPSAGDAYLVPYDGDPNYLPVTGYPLKRLYESLGKLNAKEIIVVLDSCFSGAGGRSVLARGARPLVMMAAAPAVSANMVVLSATRGSQISTSSPDKGHGVFTYYFLKAIKDGKKNLAEIYEYITPQVEEEAKMLNVQQSPSISPDVEKIKNKFSLRK